MTRNEPFADTISNRNTTDDSAQVLHDQVLQAVVTLEPLPQPALMTQSSHTMSIAARPMQRKTHIQNRIPRKLLHTAPNFQRLLHPTLVIDLRV